MTEAAAALNELQKEDASDARIYVAGWLLALRAGNAKSALASARRAVDLAPMLAMPHYCLAESLRAEGDVAGARVSAEKALVLAPDNMKFRELAVNLANALGDYAAAEAHLRIAYERDPKVPGIKTMIASAMRFQQKLAEARRGSVMPLPTTPTMSTRTTVWPWWLMNRATAILHNAR